jgi:hypothetical protein
MLLMVCVVAGCGASSERNSTHTNAARTSTGSSAPVQRGGREQVSTVSGHHRVPPADAAAITATLDAVFVHPEASQCSRSMTAQFLSQFFSADAARSGTSVLRTCRVHQRERAQLPKRYRIVTVHDLEVSGNRARAIVRGANGYPIGVSLVQDGRGWRLDASGTAIQAPGHGHQVAPQGSLYAYRIPPGFVAADTRVGPVVTSGAAYSTGVGLPDGQSADGIAVAQTAANSHIHDLAGLRAVLPQVDRAVRGSSVANVVVVNCRWPHSGPERAKLRAGCDAVLGTLAVG